MTLGLIGAVVIANGSILKALGMVLVGLLLGIVGIDINTGDGRFTFDLPTLMDGIDFVPISVGIFGLGEIISNLRVTDYRPVSTAKLQMWPTREDVRRATPAAMRGTAVGCVIGILPGGGAALSAFMSYMVEKRVARDPSILGKGAIEGVAAPEAANNAGAQTSFIPMLTLGIPGNAVMAVMVAALMIHGINPGPGVITEKPDLFWGIIASMFIGNVMLVIINLPLIGIWVSLLRIPYRVLYLAIIAFCAIGSYAFRGNPNDVLIAAMFGVVGYFFIAYRCEPAPLLLGFVLGPRLEENLRSSMLISGGDPMIFVNRPISLGLFLATLGTAGAGGAAVLPQDARGSVVAPFAGAAPLSASADLVRRFRWSAMIFQPFGQRARPPRRTVRNAASPGARSIHPRRCTGNGRAMERFPDLDRGCRRPRLGNSGFVQRASASRQRKQQLIVRGQLAASRAGARHCAAPRSRLTHTYLGGYTSIHSQRVIDPKCRTLTMCSSERSPIRPGGRSSSDCAAKESRRSGL